MTQKYTEDKRLLGALDYIDDKFIAEVTESYKIFEPSDGKITARRTLRITLRQFAALAACLILLSAAFPVINYAVKVINSFAAGWGSEATEESQTETSSETIDSPYERAIDAYPEGMSAEEIYADVIKGGWAVLDSDYPVGFIVGNDLMIDFLDKVNTGTPANLLVADYVRYAEIDQTLTGWHYTKQRVPTIFLMEIFFDGNVFNYRRFDCDTDTITDIGEYKYLIVDIYEYDGENSPKIKSGYRESYCLTNDYTWSLLDFKNNAFTDEKRTTDFFSNPCQIFATYVPVYATFDGDKIYYSSGSLGFSELIVE